MPVTDVEVNRSPGSIETVSKLVVLIGDVFKTYAQVDAFGDVFRAAQVQQCIAVQDNIAVGGVGSFTAVNDFG